MSSTKKSFLWSAVEQVGPRFVQISVTIVMARLLEPQAFGLVGMLALFIGLAQVFADSGLSTSLIQKHEITEDDETSVFALNIVIGALLTVALCAISPFVAEFYAEPILVPLLCVQSMTVFISSFAIAQRALIARAMEFHKTAMIGFVSAIVSGTIGLSMAYMGYGVWSLIASLLSSNLVGAVLIWRVSSWRPRGRVRIENIKSIWSFSSYLLYCKILELIYQNLYSVIIGKVYSAESLGYYNRANTLRMLPASTMTGVVNRVALPLLSRCQMDDVLMLQHLRVLVRSTLILSAAGLAWLALIADPLIPLLMTEKWMPSVPLLRILCYAAVMYPISTLLLMTLQAKGASYLNFRLDVIKMIVGVIVIASVFHFGVTALAWSVVGMALISYVLNAWYNVKLLNYKWRFQAFDLLPTLILCALSAVGVRLTSLYDLEAPILSICLQTGIFISSVCMGVYCFRKVFFQDPWKYWIQALVLISTYIPILKRII